MRVLLVAAVLVVAGLPAQARAQVPAVLSPVDHDQIVSGSLLGLMIKWFSVDYERKAGRSSTLGVSGSSLHLFDGALNRGNAFARFYPQGAPLRGIYLGARGGIVALPHETGAKFSAGIEVGRTWLLGPTKNVAIGSSVGIDRVFVGGGSFAIPNIRLLNVGIAF